MWNPETERIMKENQQKLTPSTKKNTRRKPKYRNQKERRQYKTMQGNGRRHSTKPMAQMKKKKEHSIS